MESQINELTENREQIGCCRGGICRGEKMDKGGQNVHTFRVHAHNHSIPWLQGQFCMVFCVFVCFCCVMACASSGLSELNFPLFSFGKGKKLWFLSEITSRWLLKLTKVPMVSAVHKSGLWRFLFTICLFIHIFLAALGLHCCTRIFSSCSEKGLLSRCDAWPLTVVAPLVAGYRLWLLGLSSCDAWA